MSGCPPASSSPQHGTHWQAVDRVGECSTERQSEAFEPQVKEQRPALAGTHDVVTTRAWLDHELLMRERISPLAQAIVDIVKDTRPDPMSYAALVHDYAIAQAQAVQLQTFLLWHDPPTDDELEACPRWCRARPEGS